MSGSATVDILALPLEVRYDIFERVLAVPEPLHIFQDPGCPLEVFIPNKPYVWLALLRTSRQISYEARAVLYGANRFTIEEVELASYRSNILKSFIKSIGSVNAGLLNHLRITFPAAERIDGLSGKIRLREDTLQNLQLLRNECTGLKALETLVYGKSSRYLTEDDSNNTQFARDILGRIDAELRSIIALNTIIVRFCSGPPASSVRNIFEGLGWTVLIGGI
ncbi:hypothetical protein PEBR_00585 [Penicillium brasilianum]|uniref:Uncharacterized protein n=1 Tax=Penicillium brasilianum TaxID=104259 RepID=A0A1S9S2J5_PENBI|nr:hypothetical protein PEBR_00585 [Penicillium brasilianum]